jgi:predicted GNAT superfamily acetyltransferase
METPAWDLASRAADDAGVELRPLVSLEDSDEIVRVMIATWGNHQLLPREMIHALNHSGNISWGAFVDGTLVAYVLGWAGMDPKDGLHIHSHMLAAIPDRRHKGVGYALKLAQRAQALDQDIHLVRWTFDPLVARNAWFNMGKLGAVADRFERNFYGEMGDALNAGERSDRLVIRWDLDPEPAQAPTPASEVPVVLARSGDPDRPAPQPSGPSEAGTGWVEIPADYAALRSSDPGLGTAWRDAVADVVAQLMERGAIVVAFDRDRSAYRFGRREVHI